MSRHKPFAGLILLALLAALPVAANAQQAAPVALEGNDSGDPTPTVDPVQPEVVDPGEQTSTVDDSVSLQIEVEYEDGDGGTLTVVDQAPVALSVLDDKSEQCPVPETDPARYEPASGNSAEITTVQAICLLGMGYKLSPEDGILKELEDPSADVTKVSVIDAWVWNEERLADRAVIVSSDTRFPITITVIPDITLTPTVSSPAVAEPAELTTEGDAALIGTIGAGIATKTIAVSGKDVDQFGDLVVTDQVPPARLQAVGDDDVPLELTDDVIELDLKSGQTTVTYQLRVAPAANLGTTSATQVTFLYTTGESRVPLADAQSTVAIQAPMLEIDVQAAAQTDAGGESTLSVRVINRDETALTLPLVVTLDPAEGGNTVESLRDAGDGVISDSNNTVSWTIDELEAGEEVLKNVVATSKPATGDGRVVWRSSVGLEQEPAIITDSVTIDVVGDSTGKETVVDFTPAQLIRLIAFVISLSLIAVVFGAWKRSKAKPPPSGQEEFHQFQLDLFGKYTETIVVLVTLVAILVLALRGTLNGESAASLIGVIAGYAFGSRGRG